MKICFLINDVLLCLTSCNSSFSLSNMLKLGMSKYIYNVFTFYRQQLHIMGLTVVQIYGILSDNLLTNARKSFIRFIHFFTTWLSWVFSLSLLGVSLQTTYDGVCAKKEIQARISSSATRQMLLWGNQVLELTQEMWSKEQTILINSL